MVDSALLHHAISINPLLELAVRAANAAGQVVASGYGALDRSKGIESKGVGDLVSQVDRDADKVCCELLQSESDLPILSEELNSSEPSAADMWIVDPLDGTNAFLMQAGPEYPAVLVALREHHETRLGVVHFPVTGEWFYAERGRGAWQHGKRLVCDSNETLNEVWVEMNQYGDEALETPWFAELRSRLRSAEGARLVTTNLPYSGVAMRIATGHSGLAVAIHDNNPTAMKQAPWDVAAPQLILEEAGGVFLNPRGKRSDPFKTEPIVVARSAALAAQVLELTATHQSS